MYMAQGEQIGENEMMPVGPQGPNTINPAAVEEEMAQVVKQIEQGLNQ